jgi:hypothetical protein
MSNSAEKRALASLQSTPQSSLTRSQSSSSKVKRRSRSKSPFRSFRWKRSSTTNGDDDGFEDEGIMFDLTQPTCVRLVLSIDVG